jgi:hypothetical protein
MQTCSHFTRRLNSLEVCFGMVLPQEAVEGRMLNIMAGME